MKQMVREHKILDEFGSRLNLNSDDKFELDGEEIGGGSGDKITANDVNSETATQGQILTADGNGGASWEDASGGKLYNHQVSFRVTGQGLSDIAYTNITINIISSNDTPFTPQTLLSYFQTLKQLSSFTGRYTFAALQNNVIFSHAIDGVNYTGRFLSINILTNDFELVCNGITTEGITKYFKFTFTGINSASLYDTVVEL